MLFHSVLVSYKADILESKDLFRMKWRSKTTTPCHISEGKKHEFLSCTLRSRRNLLKTKSRVADFSCSIKRSAVKDTHAELSMLPLLLALQEFRFIEVRPSVDTYAIFRFEPTHTLSLSISHLLKEIFSAA